MTPTARRATTLAAVSAVALSALVVPATAHAAPTLDGVTCDATTCRHVVPPDAGVTTFEVPAGVTRIAVELAGAPGPIDTPTGVDDGGGGRGGVLRTELEVTPGTVLTAHHPMQVSVEPPVPGTPSRPRPSIDDAVLVVGRGDLAALFVGEGPDARPVAVAGGGGASGDHGVGGVGGGWDPDPSRMLRGGDGEGPGAGYGATPDGPGGVRADGALVAGTPGGGPLTSPGTRGVGGHGNILTWDYVEVTETDLIFWKRHTGAPAGGNGWYGGGAASHHHSTPQTGGGGGGSGYLAPGLVATEPSATTYDAARTTGTVVLEWAVPVPAPVVPDGSGAPVTDPVAEPGVGVPLPAEPTATPGTPAPASPAAVTGGATPTATATPVAERSDVLAAADAPRSGVLAATGAQVTALGLVAVLLLLGGVALHRWRRAQAR